MEAGILIGLQSARVVGLTQLAVLIFAFGDAAFIWVALGIIMLFFSERRPAGVLVLVSVAVALVLCNLVLGPIVGRVRPCDAGIGVTAVVGVSRAGFAFPCAHAASSFAAATVIALSLGRRSGLPAVVGALLISFSCLYLGVNYPTDVLAGLLIGLVIGVAVVWLYNTFVRERVVASVGAGTSRGRTSVKGGTGRIR